MKNKHIHKKSPAQDDTAVAPVDDLGDLPTPVNNLGRGIHRRELEKFSQLEDKDKHEMLKATWKEIAMGAALRAKAFITTCSPKDFNNVYRMVMAGAVAIDKAYPPVVEKKPLASPSLVVNMFGSLGQRAAKIAMPETPEVRVIDVTTKEEPPSGMATRVTSEDARTSGGGAPHPPGDAGRRVDDDGGLDTPVDLGSGISPDELLHESRQTVTVGGATTQYDTAAQ